MKSKQNPIEKIKNTIATPAAPDQLVIAGLVEFLLTFIGPKSLISFKVFEEDCWQAIEGAYFMFAMARNAEQMRRVEATAKAFKLQGLNVYNKYAPKPAAKLETSAT